MKNQRFSFIGKFDANTDEGAKVPFARVIKTEKTKGLSINFTIIAAQNNRAFIEIPGFKNDVIQTYDSDGNKMDVAWEDRKEESILNKVANYKKNVITLDGERHEFISSYDFVSFICDNIDKIKGKRFTVTGRIKKNVYNGKISDRFEAQNIFEVREDDERKNQLKVTCDFYFNKDSFDQTDFKKEKKLVINGYTQEYIDKANPTVFVDKTLIFDCSKIDFENERHLSILNYRLKQMGCEYDNDNDKIKVDLKKGYYHIITICNYMNGAEEIEFDSSTLTPNQKLAVSLGLKTLDDFRPAGSIFGQRVVIYKLIDFDLRDDFENGCVKTDTDVEENIYTVCLNKTADEFEKAVNPPTEKDEFVKADDDFDLFD